MFFIYQLINIGVQPGPLFHSLMLADRNPDDAYRDELMELAGVRIAERVPTFSVAVCVKWKSGRCALSSAPKGR